MHNYVCMSHQTRKSKRTQSNISEADSIGVDIQMMEHNNGFFTRKFDLMTEMYNTNILQQNVSKSPRTKDPRSRTLSVPLLECQSSKTNLFDYQEGTIFGNFFLFLCVIAPS